MKDYDKAIAHTIIKYQRTQESIEERGLVFLQTPASVFEKSEKFYEKDSFCLEQIQQCYEKELLSTWTKQLPNKALTRQMAIEGYAINMMNIHKLPPLMPSKLQPCIGIYLNDYYMVYDAAKEDHDVELV